MRSNRSPHDEHQVAANPALRPVHFQRLIRVFEQDGFRLDRQEGDRRIYVKAGAKRPLVIPAYHPVPVFIVKNLLRTSGMSRDRYYSIALRIVTRRQAAKMETAYHKADRAIQKVLDPLAA